MEQSPNGRSSTYVSIRVFMVLRHYEGIRQWHVAYLSLKTRTSSRETVFFSQSSGPYGLSTYGQTKRFLDRQLVLLWETKFWTDSRRTEGCEW